MFSIFSFHKKMTKDFCARVRLLLTEKGKQFQKFYCGHRGVASVNKKSSLFDSKPDYNLSHKIRLNLSPRFGELQYSIL